MSMLDLVHSNLAVAPRAFACLEILPTVLGFGHARLFLASRELSHLDVVQIVFCSTRLRNLLLVLDEVKPGLALSAQSHTSMGFFLAALSHTVPSSSPPSHGAAHVELVLVTSDIVHPRSVVSIRRFACPSVASAALDYMAGGSMLSLRGLSHLRSSLSATGLTISGTIIFSKGHS